MKKEKTGKGWLFFFCLSQIIVALLAIFFFVVLAVNGERMLKWIPALVLSVVYGVSGVMGICRRNRTDL